jgi:predicted amidohydrolase YtcJ
MARGGCVKFFMDGVIETYTGLLLDDYADQPGNRGGALFSAEHFTRMAAEADRLGLQIFVHATGDGAVRRTLDSFEAVQQQNGRRDSRHRIEHIELLDPEDVARFAELGVIASMQPAHVPFQTPDDPDVWPARVGPERWGRSFAWQTLREGKARLAFGSDWPVAPQDPMTGIHAALNRQPWRPDLSHQRQTLADTLAGYTRDAAYAEFQEHQKGQIKIGMLADLMLLSTDLFAVPAEAVDQVRPVLTICDGRIVYEG